MKNTRRISVLCGLVLAVSLAAVPTLAQEGSTDDEVKAAALNGLRHVEPERALPVLEKFLQGNHSTKLKARALSVLARMNSPQAREIMSRTYQREPSPKIKKEIISALGRARDFDRLAEIARTESDLELRAHAVDRYGHASRRRQASSEPLLEIYRSDTNLKIRKQVLHALYIKQDARALISLARQETDPDLRREAVKNLTQIKSKEATKFLVELLNR